MATRFDQSRNDEKLEVLDGSRAGARSKAAVRIEDLDALLTSVKIRTQGITAAPTAADFNTLLADVKKIADGINAVSSSLQKRLMK